MKDYSLRNEKIKLIHAMAMSIGEDMTELFENGYDQGCMDGQKEKLANAMIHDHEVAEKTAYKQGLNDVWEVIKKITADERKGGYPIKMLNELFGSIHVYDIVHDYTPEEAIAKIKEYEDKQKCKECKKTKDPIFYGYCVGECDYAKQTEDEIKVGDEIRLHDAIEVVTSVMSTGLQTIDASGNTSTWYYDTYPLEKWEKTGRHFPQIAEVLAELRGAE